MKKKLLIAILILLIIFLISIVWVLNNPEKTQTNSNRSAHEESIPKDTILKENEPNPDEEEPSQEEETTTHTEIVTEDLKEFIIDSVREAIDFFFNKELKIVAIGDSLTQGVGDRTNQGGYVGILDQTINESKSIVQFENYGKRGNRSNQLLKRIDEEDEIQDSIAKADIILITIGANDIMQVAKENITNLTFEAFEEERVEYEKRLKEIFNKITEINPDIRIYLLGFYNPFNKYFEDIKELNMIVGNWNNTGRNVVQSFENGHFIPTDDLFQVEDVHLLAEDNFHPNYLGYQRIAERVLNYLTEQVGEISEQTEDRN